MSAPRRSAILALALLAGTAAAGAAQDVRGRVVDDASRQGVRQATVALVDADDRRLAEVTTGADGFFVLRAPGAGQFRILVVHPGYAREERGVRVGTADMTVPAFVLKTEAVVLDPIPAEAARGRDSAGVAGTFSRGSFVMAGARLARLEQTSTSMAAAVREFAGVRYREWRLPSGQPFMCIESNRHLPTLSQGAVGCQWITLILDGVTIMDPERTFRSLRIVDFESIEYLPPGAAGQRYGMAAGANGALVLWSRGSGPYVSAERNPPR